MKKFLLCFILLLAGLSCKKDQVLCGCSPIQYSFFMSVKDADNHDLMAPNATGGSIGEKIKLFYKDGANLKPIDFVIRPPFSYGSNAEIKYEFYQLYSPALMQHRVSGKTEFYIQFGDAAAMPLSFDIDKDKNSASNVKINNTPLVRADIDGSYPPLWVLVI
jgi:hypothetical protein